MVADRRIDPAGPRQAALRARRDDALVERFPHAVQALKFVLPGITIRPGQLMNDRQRMRIVRGELRIDRIRRRQQLARAGQVGDVGINLARVDRIAFEPVDLRPLDLAVPIGALHQPDHQAAPGAPRQRDHMIQHVRTALLVRLHDKADAVPAQQIGFGAEPLEQVERDVEAVGLLGIDVEPDIELPGQPRQGQQPRIKLGDDAAALRAAVARMQRGQLDRDARPLIDAGTGRRLADGMDGVLVGPQVARRVRRGERGLAEHVVGIAEALALPAPGALERQLDGLPGHELVAHQPHRHVDAPADQRLAAFPERARQRIAEAGLGMGGDQSPGNYKAPGGGVDEQRPAMSQMRAPVGITDLVPDQRIAGRLVGNPQQRLGQAHQRHALLRGQREFLDQALDQPLPAESAGVIAQGARQIAREPLRRIGLRRRQPRRIMQRGDAVGLRTPIGRRDPRPRFGRRLNGAGEILEERAHDIPAEHGPLYLIGRFSSFLARVRRCIPRRRAVSEMLKSVSTSI